MPTVVYKKLSDGQVSLFDRDTGQMILVPKKYVKELAKVPQSGAWSQANKMVAAGQASSFQKTDLMAVQESMSFVVLLNGGGGWPP
jgi:hypothetical protein